jgi:NAD(P)-dependent dehydrogenase (short-subunit alcohol dehydrogenase family)
MSASRVDLEGTRLLLVGASSGIGEATALAAIHAGASVALAARRVHRLEETLAAVDGAAPGRGVAVSCDVRSPSSIDHAVAQAVEDLGGLDAVIYATGVNHLALLEETSADAWREQFETNVVGASLVTAAALPALRSSSSATPASRARIGYLSSHSVPHPWPGLVSYAATKAALETMIQGWRTEEADVTFTRIVIGPTITPMAEAWDRDRAAAFFARWDAERRLVGLDPVAPALVAGEIVAWLADPAATDDLFMPNSR